MINELKKKKPKLERKFKKNSNNQNYAEYKKQKLLYYSSLKQTRTAYYSGILQDSETNSKILYNTIQMLSGDNKEKVLPSAFLVELFSDYFHEKIVSIRSNLNTNSQQEILINDKQSRVLVCDQMEEFLPVSTTELKTIISSMNNKNCLLDPAPVKSMRQWPQVILPLIQFIINKSFKESHVPCQLKQVTITPIIKRTDLDAENLKNYRPISNMTFISKVLEKVGFNQISKHVQKNDLLSPNQSGYKQYHSCETALLEVVNNIQQFIQNGNLTAVLMLDLSVAFDQLIITVFCTS